MSNYTDYVKTGANKFVELQDTPSTYDAGKYVKVESDGLNYSDVDATLSGINDSGGGLNYKYKFDTSISGTVVSGTFQFNNTNYRAVSKIGISYFDMNGADLTTWINSWDDSDKAVKGTATFKGVTDDTKYVTYKLKETGGSMFGDGSDGPVVVSGTVNLNTTALAAGRTYPDMVAYSVSSVGASSCQVAETPNGIAVGDAVLLINLQGAGSSQADNVGNYEIFTVDEVVSTTIVFKEEKTKLYGNNGGDSNIGTTGGTQRVMLMRVPQYSTLNIMSGGNITANAWDTSKYGVMCIKCSTLLKVIGSIAVDKLGFKGGTDAAHEPGGSYTQGVVYNGPNPNVGGGAHGSSSYPGGSGGSYGTRGEVGYHHVDDFVVAGQSYTYGTADLSKVYLGSGGGGRGLPGAGACILITKELELYGSITSAGDGPGYDSSGSGGSILINTNKVTMNAGSITAHGGPRAYDGGTGGDGRIAIYHNILMDSFSNVDPVPYTDDLIIAGSSTSYNAEWLNGNNTFDNDEEVFVSYSYNY